jgi:membrane associated rhomboid family serine protease
MLKSIAEDIRQQFDYGNRITRLIIINAAVFIAINMVRLGFTLFAGFQHNTQFDDVVRFFSVSADLVYTATHPWVIFTHMFLHVGFWHFLFNMLFLYWFGRIVGDFLGDDRVVPLYLMSGLFGALIYLIFAPLINASGSYAYGASASVMGFVMASGLIAPEYNMRLLLIGDVKLKYIVLVLILLDLFGIASLDNTGGHLAHLGGVAFGWIFVAMLRRGNDIAAPVNRVLDAVSRIGSGKRRVPSSRHTSKVFVRHKSAATKKHTTDKPPRTKDYQERLDTILDKIKDKGYDSL